MPLYVPKSSAHFWTYDNFGANPGTTLGTSVTPGASNAEGSWASIAGSANITVDVRGVYLNVHSGASTTIARNHLLDIGIDPAGGTSYTELISNLAVSESPALTLAGSRQYFFPIRIPAGSSVAARVRGSAATASTVRVAARFYGRGSAPEFLPTGSFARTFGAVEASSIGTSFTPGNAADGSWVLLGTTSEPLWWWQVGYGINNGTITAEYTYIDLAFGDGTNFVPITRITHGGTTAEVCGAITEENLVWHAAYCPVPAGAGIYVRGRCNNAPDTGYYAVAVGVG